MPPSDLQNSYGPEIDTSSNLPQAILPDSGGLEAVPATGQVPPYHEQAEKNYNNNNNDAATAAYYNGTSSPPRRKRILGLPVLAFWAVIIGLVVILAVALGAGLGVGLSERSGESNTSAAAASTSAQSDTATTTTSSAISSTTSSSSSTITTSATTTTTSSAPEATARNVEICNNASLDTCKNLSVPVNTCIEFPTAYNDSVSSVDTGGPECYFYTGENCSGDSWATNGTQYTIPAKYNDMFSSVACFVN